MFLVLVVTVYFLFDLIRVTNVGNLSEIAHPLLRYFTDSSKHVEILKALCTTGGVYRPSVALQMS